MAYTIEQFSQEAHRILAADPGPEGRKKIGELVSRACTDPDFVANHLPDNGPERKILYEDPELGFCILGHVYHGAKQSQPHDHGPTWAIYGQAVGETIMTDWEKLSPASESADRQGAARARLHAEARRRLCVQRRRSAFAAARRLDQADPHRGPQRRENPPLPVRSGSLAVRPHAGVLRDRSAPAIAVGNAAVSVLSAIPLPERRRHPAASLRADAGLPPADWR